MTRTLVREQIATSLEDLGMTVLQAADAGPQRGFWSRRERIDVLVTDVVLPGGNGRAARRRGARAAARPAGRADLGLRRRTRSTTCAWSRTSSCSSKPFGLERLSKRSAP